MKIILKEIKKMSSKILDEGDLMIKSNITVHDVNAMLTISAGLTQGYEILKKMFEKGAIPPNSVGGNLNATNLTMRQNQNKDNHIMNNTVIY